MSSPQGTVKIGDNRHDHKVGSSVLSFLTPVIYVFFWGPVVSLPKGLSILFVFSKKQLWVSLIFSIVFLFSISLISALIFIFFLMLALFFFVVVLLLILVPLCIELAIDLKFFYVSICSLNLGSNGNYLWPEE